MQGPLDSPGQSPSITIRLELQAVAERQFLWGSQLPVPSSGIQNTSQFNSRNLAHLQNKLLLSLAHSHPRKSVEEQNAQSGMHYSPTGDFWVCFDVVLQAAFLCPEAKNKTHPVLLLVDL